MDRASETTRDGHNRGCGVHTGPPGIVIYTLDSLSLLNLSRQLTRSEKILHSPSLVTGVLAIHTMNFKLSHMIQSELLRILQVRIQIIERANVETLVAQRSSEASTSH
jgi:hypothetical protein